MAFAEDLHDELTDLNEQNQHKIDESALIQKFCNFVELHTSIKELSWERIFEVIKIISIFSISFLDRSVIFQKLSVLCISFVLSGRLWALAPHSWCFNWFGLRIHSLNIFPFSSVRLCVSYIVRFVLFYDLISDKRDHKCYRYCQTYYANHVGIRSNFCILRC